MEEFSDEEVEGKDEALVVDEGKNEVAEEQPLKKVRLKGKKQGKVQDPLRQGDT